jgi:hypothetical protein
LTSRRIREVPRTARYKFRRVSPPVGVFITLSLNQRIYSFRMRNRRCNGKIFILIRRCPTKLLLAQINIVWQSLCPGKGGVTRN